MSYPILYLPTETDFNHNGIGILGDCVSCVVTEEANGAFELDLKYPMDGIHYSQIVDRSIIKAKPNQEAEPQLFRVYSISKPMSGIVSVFAEHISYDLSGIPVCPFAAAGVQEAMAGLGENAVVYCPFSFETDKTLENAFSVSVPGSIRSKLGGSDGSILDVYGGEFEFDNYNVFLHTSRGRHRGVSIRYGKNLTDIKQDRNCASVYTGVYPYWVNAETGEVTQLAEKIIEADGTYSFVKIKMLDVSGAFQEKPSEDDIRTYAQDYMAANSIGVPVVSLSVSFKQLEQSEEYKGLYLLEKVSLFDTLLVEFPALGVSATAKAVKIVYDVLLNRVDSVTLGSVKAKITDTVAQQQQQISNAPTKEYVKVVSEAATAWLTNGKGYKVERRNADGNTIDTLYMDTPDIETAVNVLRIGQSGIGFSENGVDGPYFSAWTLDGTFDASVINVINLVADSVVSGILKSKDGTSYFDLDNNKIVTGNVTASGGTIGGCEIVNGVLRVPAANITGKLTASQINADGISAENVSISGVVNAATGSIGKWTLGYKSVTDVSTVYAGNALYSTQYVNGVETTVILMPEILCVQEREGDNATQIVAPWADVAGAAITYANS